MGVPRVVSSASPSFPRESLDVAAAPAQAIAGLGAGIEQMATEWARREHELRQFTELNEKAAAASRQLDEVARFEDADPDYNTLGPRVESQSRALIDTIAASIQDRKVRAEFTARANDAALHRIRSARDTQRRRQIGAGVAALDDRMDAISDRLVMADPAESISLMAEAQGLVAGGNAAGIFDDENAAQDYFNGWQEEQDHATVIRDMNLDVTGTRARLLEGDYQGISPVKRQDYIAAADREIERLGKGVPNAVLDGLTSRLNTNPGTVQFGDISGAYLKGQIDEHERNYLDGLKRDSIARALAASRMGQNDYTNDAEKLLRMGLHMDDESMADIVGIGTIQYVAQGKWLDMVMAGAEPVAAARQVINEFRQQIPDAVEQEMESRTFHVPPEVKAAAQSGDFFRAITMMGTRDQAILENRVAEYDQAAEELRWWANVVGFNPNPTLPSRWDRVPGQEAARQPDTPPVSAIPDTLDFDAQLEAEQAARDSALARERAEKEAARLAVTSAATVAVGRRREVAAEKQGRRKAEAERRLARQRAEQRAAERAARKPIR